MLNSLSAHTEYLAGLSAGRDFEEGPPSKGRDFYLRAEGRLGAASGIEYAAQAMAVHGALLAGASDRPRHGYLTSLRGVTLHVARLDDLPGELSVRAERLSSDGRHVLYRFVISHAGRCLVEGRAAVVLDAEAISQDARR